MRLSERYPVSIYAVREKTTLLVPTVGIKCASHEARKLPWPPVAGELGAAVLELTGRGQATPWFTFLNQLRRETPVVQKTAYVTADGGLAAESALPEAVRERLVQWRRWSYYKLKYKEIRQ